MTISCQPSQYWCELSPLHHPTVPECSGLSHTQLAGAALLPYNSNEAVFSQYSTTDLVAIDWEVASGHWRESQRIWMAQVMFEHWEKEETEKSVLKHSLLLLICSYTCTFQALWNKTPEKYSELQKYTTAKYQSFKMSEVAAWIELSNFSTAKKTTLKLNPVFVAAVNWTTVTVLCTQLK